MTLVDVLVERSEEKSLGITFIENSNQEYFLSYHSLFDCALKLLSSFQKRKMQPKSELVLQVDDNKSFLIAFWACILGGIIPVPLSMAKNEDHNKKLSQVWSLLTTPTLIISRKALKTLEEYLENSRLNGMLTQIRSNCLFVEDIFLPDEKGTIYKPGEQDIAFVQFSSGSTGNPKGVMLTHGNLIANVSGIAFAASYSKKDSMLNWMPLSHDMGIIGFHISPLFCGLNQYHLPTNLFVKNPKIWIEKVSEHKITITASPNFGYKYLLKHLSDRENWDLSCVRIIYNGAEPISKRLCTEFNEKMAKFGLSDTAMCPVYGLAEASVAVCISPVDQRVSSITLSANSTFVNVGKPVDGCAIQITNERNQVPAENTIGHIKIKGTNVTSGYYNNESAYQEITDEHGWLNTGDLGFIKDGSLYVTGRVKDVICINGHNFYAHDIEKEAESVEGIELNKIAVCSAFIEESQSEEIIAFLVHRGVLQKLIPIARSLKMCVNEKFGIELNKIIPVKHIPKTTSGKLKRFKLQESYRNGEFRDIEKAFTKLLDSSYDDTIVPAANEMEERLLSIWKNVLASESIGVEHKFSQVGGNSMKGTALIMNVQQEFQVNLSIRKLYELQTVKKLAAELVNMAPKTYESIPKMAGADSYPVASSQRRIYYACRMDPDAVTYNLPVAIRLEGHVDTQRLKMCLAHLISRHTALRMTFFLAGEPRFRIKENCDVGLEVINCEEDECDRKLKSLVLPFDLGNGPLFRFFLFDLDRSNHKEYILLLDFHHLISDGRSVYLFIDELLKMYRGSVLPDVNISFADYVTWEQGLARKTKQSVKQFWIDRFSGELPLLEIARDFPRPGTLNGKGKRLLLNLGSTVSAKLKDIWIKHNITGHSLFFTLYNILLAKYSGQADIIIGIPAHGRLHPDLQQVQGLFVNNLPIRCMISGQNTFIGLLKTASEEIREAIDQQELAFDDLLKMLDIRPRPGRSPLFDTMFLYQNLGINDDQAGFICKRYPFDPGFSKFDLSLEIFEEKEQISYAFEYSTQLFKDETVLELSKGFQNIIHQISENTSIRIEDITCLNDEEFHDHYTTYHTTGNEMDSFLPVHELFEKQVEKHPDNIAIEFDGRKLSYKGLNDKANKVADFLKNKGINKGDLVGVHLKRSPELIAGILGILKSGAAYLPLEWEMPAERMKYIIENSGCKLLLSATELADPDPKNRPPEHVPCRNHPSDLAYVIYTSGTTGQPKGVIIGHGSFSNYIVWASNRYIDAARCSFPFYSSISFDLTVTSVFLPLVTGNTMFIYAEKDTEISIETVIRENLVDIIKLTPSHLRVLKENNLLSARSRVRKLIVGGEALDTQLARDVYDLMGGEVEIFNEYGPTEATVGCMIYKFDPDDSTATVPIGRPIDNTQVYLLDNCLKPIPTNVPGEIYIAGKGLSKGYLFLEGLTGERFIDNPFIKGERIYKTGDIAKRLPNGNIEFIGRNDRQVRISGNRVEPGEIESRMMRSGKVREVAVVADPNHRDHLHAYFTSIDPESESWDTFFRNYLAENLPYFMIPREFIPLLSMPLTRNGKIDIARLHSFRPANSSRKKAPPKTATERLLVKIWSDVLNAGEIGISDNFFEQGGDSIKAVQISSRLFEEGISVKVKDILTYHTIENISQHTEPVSSHQSCEQGIVAGLFKPTPIQRWFFSQRFKNPNYYNQSVLLAVRHSLDIIFLERTFKALIEHHDTLRVNYDPETHTFFYNNKHLEEEVVIQEFELQEGCGLSDICNKVRGSLNISAGFLIKMAIIRKRDEGAFLFITAHHLIMDGISWRIFLEDFYRVYSSIAEGNEVRFPPKTASFKSWSALVIQLSEAPEIEKQREYWRHTETSSFVLPMDFQAARSEMKDVKKIAVRLDKETTTFLLKDAIKAYNTDVPILLNCALVLTLNKWTGLTEFVIEQESHGRNREALNISRTIGWFTSMYPVKLVYTEGIDLLVKNVKESIRKAPDNGIGYGIYAFPAGKSAQQPGLAEVRLNYLGQFGAELDNKLISFTQEASGSETDPNNAFTAKLEFNAMISGGELQTEIAYNTRLFKENTINELSKQFLDNLTSIVLYLKNKEDRYFTPSDFSGVDLDEEEINTLFGDNNK
jgi:amino acid adenylation domain-containing protein/non-ribosomal peptide synthase protein (TIGR01720 family)